MENKLGALGMSENGAIFGTGIRRFALGLFFTYNTAYPTYQRVNPAREQES